MDFLEWKSDAKHRSHDIMRRYHVQDSDTYHKYNKLCGQLRQLAHRLALLPPADPFRHKHERLLLAKLHAVGLLTAAHRLSDVENRLTVAALCRRRLPVVMTRLRMAENVPAAVRLVEQGHVRVGPDVVSDPAFIVSRALEDFVTWVDTSKIRRHILKYRDQVDDFDLLA